MKCKTYLLGLALFATPLPVSATTVYGPVVADPPSKEAAEPYRLPRLSETTYARRGGRYRDPPVEAVFHFMNSVDINLTREALSYPNVREVNPILGRNPSGAKLVAFGALISILHRAVSKELRQRDDQTLYYAFQVLSTGMKTYAVVNNHNVIERARQRTGR